MAEPATASAARVNETPTLDFERPVVDLERKIEELIRVSGGASELRPQIALLESARPRAATEDLRRADPLAEGPALPPPRPALHARLHRAAGRRSSSSCTAIAASPTIPAIVGGFGTFDGMPVLVLGHQKGRSTKEKVQRNFGQPKPEGYRKALRLMELAARMRRPILCLIDTQGAYPGVDAEERGQAEAIAKNLEVMAGLPVPIICAVIGEGGSGGALALGVANRILMLEYATYSVISPEGCASILWRDDSKKPEAAAAMKMTATDLQRLGDRRRGDPGGAGRRAPRPRSDGAQPGRGAAPPPGRAVRHVARGAARGSLRQVPPHGGVRRIGRQGGPRPRERGVRARQPRRCGSTPATSRRW